MHKVLERVNKNCINLSKGHDKNVALRYPVLSDIGIFPSSFCTIIACGLLHCRGSYYKCVHSTVTIIIIVGFFSTIITSILLPAELRLVAMETIPNKLKQHLHARHNAMHYNIILYFWQYIKFMANTALYYNIIVVCDKLLLWQCMMHMYTICTLACGTIV